jgi:cytochrome c oxidase assembly factor CtaG
MESTRRLVIAATLGVAVIALAATSDFLFGSFWSSHAMLTSLIASLLVLAVTVVVLNVALDRRDRRR